MYQQSQQIFQSDVLKILPVTNTWIDWLSGFLVSKLTGIIILAWDDAIQGGCILQFNTYWHESEWSREHLNLWPFNHNNNIEMPRPSILGKLFFDFLRSMGYGSKLKTHSLSFWKLSIKYIYATLPFGSFLEKQGVCHTVALPFALRSILRQKKKNYGNSNISPCKNIIFKKIL